METQVERIREKLDELRLRDQRFAIFGSPSHHYVLRRCLTEAQLRDVEMTYGISLPVEYRAFLTHLGNGGAGPDYGLFSLGQSLESTFGTASTSERRRLYAQPFPHTQPWNMGRRLGEPLLTKSDIQTYEATYFSDEHLRGSLRIHSAGDNHGTLLVLTGPERGSLWHDERTVDCGLFPYAGLSYLPERLTFFDWYEAWLDTSLGLREPEKPWPQWYRSWLDTALGVP